MLHSKIILFLFCSFGFYSDLAFGQVDDIPFSHACEKGFFLVSVNRSLKTSDTPDTLHFKYETKQRIISEDWREDMTLAFRFVDGQRILKSIQQQEVLLNRYSDSTCTSQVFDGKNEMEKIGSSIDFLKYNIRYIEFLKENYFQDTVNEDGVTLITQVKQAGQNTFFIFYQFFNGDSSWDFYNVKISILDSTEFNESFQSAMQEMKSLRQVSPFSNDMAEPMEYAIELDSLTQEILVENNLNGNVRQSLEGSQVLLYFYFNSCSPCKLAKPHILEWSRNLDIRVIAINISDKDSAEIVRVWEESGMAEIPLVGDLHNDIARLFFIQSAPTLLVFDKNGKLIHREIGFNLNNYRELYSNLH